MPLAAARQGLALQPAGSRFGVVKVRDALVFSDGGFLNKNLIVVIAALRVKLQSMR